jgi:hypothetical protein
MATINATAAGETMGYLRSFVYATIDAFSPINPVNSTLALPMLVPASALPYVLDAIISEHIIQPAVFDKPFAPALFTCWFSIIFTLLGFFIRGMEEPSHHRVVAAFFASAVLEYLVIKPLIAVLFDMWRSAQLDNLSTAQ